MGRRTMGKLPGTGANRKEERYSDREHKINPRSFIPYKGWVANRRGNRFKRGYETPPIGAVFGGWTVISPEFRKGQERHVCPLSMLS